MLETAVLKIKNFILNVKLNRNIKQIEELSKKDPSIKNVKVDDSYIDEVKELDDQYTETVEKSKNPEKYFEEYQNKQNKIKNKFQEKFQKMVNLDPRTKVIGCCAVGAGVSGGVTLGIFLNKAKKNFKKLL